MTEQQLAEIEARWADNEVTMQTINDFNLLLAEVRRLNRMLDSACNLLTMDSMFSVDRWRKFLESEVADK